MPTLLEKRHDCFFSRRLCRGATSAAARMRKRSPTLPFTMMFTNNTLIFLRALIIVARYVAVDADAIMLCAQHVAQQSHVITLRCFLIIICQRLSLFLLFCRRRHATLHYSRTLHTGAMLFRYAR